MKRIINSELEVERKPLHKLSINWADVPFKNCTPMYPVKTEKKDAHWLCRCKCNKLFIASVSNLKNNKNISCGCSSNRNVNLTNKYFGRLKALEPTNKRNGTNVIWKCQCECGNIIEVSTNNLGRRVNSCGCLNSSKGEELIQKILQQNSINFERQKRFDSCRDERPLPFDFYLSNYNTLIEYDGEQHFGLGRMWGEKDYYNILKRHDIIKNDWCKKNSIFLIRIPYTHYKNLSIDDLLPQTSQFILS